nr:septal ring lytic transglycosylase RlpA family protein [Flavobacterium sp.]
MVKVKSHKKKNHQKVIGYTKIDTSKSKLKNGLEIDSLKVFDVKLKFLKKNAHASYYANKFNGRRTASGKSFDNNGYTAAHKKLPFGTKVKVTNQTNGKSVIVEITDRGPFSKVREIDLSKKAFMDIASNKSSGVVIVTLEEVESK